MTNASPQEPTLMDEQEWQPSKQWPVVIIAAVIVVVVIAMVSQLDLCNREVSPKALEKVAAGYQALLLDSFENFVTADEEFQSALVISHSSPETLGAYAELELHWAEAILADGDPRFAPSLYYFHFNRGKTAALKAAQRWPTYPSVRRARSALYRLQVPPDKAAAQALYGENEESLEPRDLYELANIAMLAPADFDIALSYLKQAVIKEPKLLCAHFKIAQIYLASQPPAMLKAIEQLDILLRMNPDHERAKKLRATLADK